MVYNTPPNPSDRLSQPPNPGGFPPDPGPYGYQGTPTPIGYQNPSQFGQPPYSGQSMWTPARPGIGGGVGRFLLALLIGPGALRRGSGGRRFFRYVQIAFWLIVIGICLYVGFAKHTWVITCTGNNCGD